MDAGYKIPFRNKIARIFLRPTFRFLYHLLGRVEISGKENIPQEGAYIVAQNHVSTFDSPFILVFWPNQLEVAGASDVWERRGQSILAKLYGGIKVHRGQYDRKLIEKTLFVLKSGYPLLIAPEGGRSKKPGMRKAKSGVAYLSDKANVPVIPVGICGSGEEYLKDASKGKKPLIMMRIGKSITLPPIEEKGLARREKLHHNTDLIMRKIADLLPPEYSGFYS
jgi:1-acyl-sn-glycerol-3-phosphate acyltransferase